MTTTVEARKGSFRLSSNQRVAPLAKAAAEGDARGARPTRIAILGGGPAGLGAALQLVSQNKAEAIVLEQRDEVGGNAGSFELDGLMVDYGSHRLHPACQPQILSDLRAMLGDDLLDRPRHGRIRLRGHWLHFPLKDILPKTCFT